MLVLLYVLDSLRRDFLGSYGDSGAHTPHLDRVAAQAVRFTNAYTAAPWSKASGAAMFTGELPRAVAMRGLLDRLPSGVPTIAEQLQAQQFRTIAVSANPFISRDFDLLRGFDTTVEAFRPGVVPYAPFHFHQDHFRRLAEVLSVDPAALVLAPSDTLHAALLENLDPTRNTFALCWSMDTHAPFFVRGNHSYFGNPLDRVIPAADPLWLTNGITARDMVALYRDMIAYNDAQFGELVAQLQQRGVWDDALVIVTGDHGEGFGEHGIMGHTNGLWEEQIAVPLLVKLPRQQHARLEETPVSLAAIPSWIHSVMANEPLVVQPQSLFIESPDGWALRRDDYKVIALQDAQEPLLFNLATDSHEQQPLGDKTLKRDLVLEAAHLRDEADAKARTLQTGASLALDPHLAERLRGLGYL